MYDGDDDDVDDGTGDVDVDDEFLSYWDRPALRGLLSFELRSPTTFHVADDDNDYT